ncbi:HIRAN domain-containing protein [uncultured Ruminococcus sp.]|uniref:HIRAN domain-containing protein n=1 Tax=uncultured Ruminococcus sp. TaxID=165186 RepID=UPI0025E36823|nr:HIRAN domain-containing protein [uncultured Ruminococcus sp.]
MKIINERTVSFMEDTYYVTITGINHYYGKKPFEIGRIFRLVKDKDNEYDSEAIAVVLPFIDRIGYVANSTSTVYSGTCSAGRLYDKFKGYTYARVMFVTHSSAIAEVLDRDEVEGIDDYDDEISESEPEERIKPKTRKRTAKQKQAIGFKG